MKKHAGFVMLITLVVLGLVTAMVLNVWFIAGFQRDIVDEYERWHENFYATKKALDMVVERIVENNIVVPGVFDVSKTVCKRDGYTVVVSVTRPEKGSRTDLLVSAVMRYNNAKLCLVRCLVTKKIKGKRLQHEVHGFTLA